MASSTHCKKNALIGQTELLAMTQKINTLSVHDLRAISNSASVEVKQKRPQSSSNNRQASTQKIKQNHRPPSDNRQVSVSVQLVTKETSATVRTQRLVSDKRHPIRQEVVTKEEKYKVKVTEVSYNYSGKEKGKSINMDKAKNQKNFHKK